MWFWYGIMLIFTVASFFYWAFALLIPYFGRRYICRTLLLYERSNDDRFGEIKDFELQVNVASELIQSKKYIIKNNVKKNEKMLIIL